jgi:hypothetical protein
MRDKTAKKIGALDGSLWWGKVVRDPYIVICSSGVALTIQSHFSNHPYKIMLCRKR